MISRLVRPRRTPANRPPQSRLRTIWSHGVRPLLVIILVISTFRSAVADWNDVPSQSMEPTILTGDRIIVNRLAYDLKVPFTRYSIAEWGAPERGDIIIFEAPHNDVRMVKRVVGLPGDRITLISNRLYVNGSPVGLELAPPSLVDTEELADPLPHLYAEETIGSDTHLVMFQPSRASRHTMAAIDVPEGQFFVMGDNRDNSGDSRVFGLVPRDRIMGKVVGVAFSLDLNHGFAPRWDRFWSGL
ncbi:MAG: signal peptidase I [Phycisphaerales bacterium]|nr:signal peptidase I [Phycisphaerales bacterium]